MFWIFSLAFISLKFSIIFQWLICFAFKVPKRRDIKHLSWQFSFSLHTSFVPRSLLSCNRTTRRRLLRFFAIHFTAHSFPLAGVEVDWWMSVGRMRVKSMTRLFAIDFMSSQVMKTNSGVTRWYTIESRLVNFIFNKRIDSLNFAPWAIMLSTNSVFLIGKSIKGFWIQWIFDDVMEKESNLLQFPFFHKTIFCLVFETRSAQKSESKLDFKNSSLCEKFAFIGALNEMREASTHTPEARQIRQTWKLWTPNMLRRPPLEIGNV